MLSLSCLITSSVSEPDFRLPFIPYLFVNETTQPTLSNPRVSKFPNPESPDVPGSGRTWALGTAAYIACYLIWILVVFILYELVYSFARKWRLSACRYFLLQFWADLSFVSHSELTATYLTLPLHLFFSAYPTHTCTKSP